VGYSDQGLPIGMQAIGRPWEEVTLLRLARAAEEVIERRKPQVWYRILDI
jgi:Asp-tRNA(Asn)/Glu-tRNA(Gln) amidotransferase A subunit family amidase